MFLYFKKMRDNKKLKIDKFDHSFAKKLDNADTFFVVDNSLDIETTKIELKCCEKLPFGTVYQKCMATRKDLGLGLG